MHAHQRPVEGGSTLRSAQHVPMFPYAHILTISKDRGWYYVISSTPAMDAACSRRGSRIEAPLQC